MSINQQQAPNPFTTTVVTSTCTSVAINLFTKFFKRSLVILAAFLLGQNNANAVVVLNPVTNTTTMIGYSSLQAAIDAASNGQTLVLNTDITEGLITVNKDITITSTFKKITSTSPTWGVSITSPGVEFTNIVIENAGTFGFITDCAADNLTVNSVTVQNCGGTGFAIAGCDNSFFYNLTSSNNDGNGISITNCVNTYFSGITTSGNAFGGGFSSGIGIFTSPAYCPGGGSGTTSGITLTGSINISEPVKSYQQAGSGSISTVTFNPTSGSTGAFTHYMGLGADKFFASSLSEAKTLADNTILSNAAFKTLVHIQEISSGKKLVFSTAPNMSIQAAVNNSIDGTVIEIENGNYNENVTVNKNVTWVFAADDDVTIDNVIINTQKQLKHNKSFNTATLTNSGLYSDKGWNGKLINNGIITPTQP